MEPLSSGDWLLSPGIGVLHYLLPRWQFSGPNALLLSQPLGSLGQGPVCHLYSLRHTSRGGQSNPLVKA